MNDYKDLVLWTLITWIYFILPFFLVFWIISNSMHVGTPTQTGTLPDPPFIPSYYFIYSLLTFTTKLLECFLHLQVSISPSSWSFECTLIRYSQHNTTIKSQNFPKSSEMFTFQNMHYFYIKIICHFLSALNMGGLSIRVEAFSLLGFWNMIHATISWLPLLLSLNSQSQIYNSTFLISFLLFLSLK